MKLRVLIGVFVAVQVMTAQQILTDLDVVKMVQAGVAQDIVLKLIAESPAVFSLQANHIVAWKQAGVPDEVMRAMVARAGDGTAIRYVHFSSEVRVIPPKRGGRRWAHLKIW